MNNLIEYLRKIWKSMVFFGLCMGIMGGIFLLYGISAEPVIYGEALCALAGLAAFFSGYQVYVKRKRNLELVRENMMISLGKLLPPGDGCEALYQEMLQLSNGQRMRAENSRNTFLMELNDYYTMWVHQIKTPIAAMRLLLSENAGENRAALGELFKIEQYVEMVLGYLRTEDMAADMQFQECDLDEIVREQIRKHARIFIGKKLSLEYEGVQEKVLTDAKWLGFVIGQILSNSLKYTKTGKISIYMSAKQPHTLVIADTGIGVSTADLPRVFEKGFTGHNGREESHSTGIGLYLCAKIMKKLGHKIYMDSRPGEGTKVYLELGRRTLDLY